LLKKKEFDLFTIVAQRANKQTMLLHWDVLQVPDVAEASISKRSFQKLINN
jgi:predicted ATPase